MVTQDISKSSVAQKRYIETEASPLKPFGNWWTCSKGKRFTSICLRVFRSAGFLSIPECPDTFGSLKPSCARWQVLSSWKRLDPFWSYRTIRVKTSFSTTISRNRWKLFIKLVVGLRLHDVFLVICKLLAMSVSSFQCRDLKAIGQKFFHVLIPRKSKALLRDCKYAATSVVHSSTMMLHF